MLRSLEAFPIAKFLLFDFPNPIPSSISVIYTSLPVHFTFPLFSFSDPQLCYLFLSLTTIV
jgi:hypothetical protein